MRPPLHPFRSASLALLCAGLLAAPGAAAQAIGRGFDLERAGRLADAAEVYLGTLRADSTNLAALLALERVLPALARLPELLPLARRALAADLANAALRALVLRTYVGMNERDSARAVALRWAAAAPHSEAPYREWAIALEDRQLMDEARGVLLLGRRALGQPAALAVELAELLARTGDWEGAAREWGAAVTADPAQSPSGASLLGEAPDSERERVTRVLTAGEVSREARRLGGELLLGWGQPSRAWAVFEATIDPPSSDVVYALRRFADRAGAWSTPDARRVRALALSRFAALVPPQMAVRARADAARAFTAAGDRAAARAQLALVAADPTAPLDVQALAETAVLETLIEDGQLDSAAARLAGAGDKLGADNRAALQLALARARIARGELARADSGLAGDSSVTALALRGWIALYRGELTQAATLFRAAGPYALDRSDATRRTAMLALLAHIPQGRLPDLGGALLLLARADSAAAVAALRRAADQLSTEGGRPDVLLLAGRVAARLDPAAQRAAAQLFEEVVRTGGAGAAPPAAELEWARLLVRQGWAAEAVPHLEHLILTYPGSAVVPEARRELDQARGAIPRS